MSANENPPAETADIGQALVAALGFEPADGKKRGLKGSAAGSDGDGSGSAETITLDDATGEMPTDEQATNGATVAEVAPDGALSDDAAPAEGNGSVATIEVDELAEPARKSKRDRIKNRDRSSDAEDPGGDVDSAEAADDIAADDDTVADETAADDTAIEDVAVEADGAVGAATEVEDSGADEAPDAEDESVGNGEVVAETDGESGAVDDGVVDAAPADDGAQATADGVGDTAGAHGGSSETSNVETILNDVATPLPTPDEPAPTGEIPQIRSEDQPPPPSAADAIAPVEPNEATAPLDATETTTMSVESLAQNGVPTSPPAMPNEETGVAAAAAVTGTVPVTPVAEADTTITEAPPAELPAVAPVVPATGPGSINAKVSEKLGGARITKPGASPLGDMWARFPLRRTRRVQARKVRRVIRHIDPWSVLTFSVLFHLCVFAALLLASVLVWNAAEAAGTIENLETFILDLGDYDTFEIKGEVVFRAAVAIAGILTLASSVLIVLLTVVFNLISDLVGGIRLTVIEEETVRVKRRKRTSA